MTLPVGRMSCRNLVTKELGRGDEVIDRWCAGQFTDWKTSAAQPADLQIWRKRGGSLMSCLSWCLIWDVMTFDWWYTWIGFPGNRRGFSMEGRSWASRANRSASQFSCAGRLRSSKGVSSSWWLWIHVIRTVGICWWVALICCKTSQSGLRVSFGIQVVLE